MDLDKYLEKYPQGIKSTIIKEIMHYEILDSLFSINDIQKSLVFQGGTALRLCYGIDRYSEDLDFVMNPETKFDKDFMSFFSEIFIEKILKKYNLEAEITESKKDETIILRWNANVYIPSSGSKTKINIKVADIPSHKNKDVFVNNNYPELLDKRIYIRTETREEILADKILALAERPYLKFRDLWDIEWLKSNRVETDYNLIRAKIQDYKSQNFTQGLKDRKVQLQNQSLETSFLNEMKRYLDEKYYQQVESSTFFETIKEVIIGQIDDVLNHTSNVILPSTHKPRKLH